MSRLFVRLLRDRQGATLLEFAFVAPVLISMIMAMLDLGHTLYVKSVLNGAVQKAGRDSSLQTEATNANAIDQVVKNAVATVAPGVTFVITRKRYQDFSNIGSPEPFVDTNKNGTRDRGECFQDINGNGVWDTDSSQASQGSASDAAVYTVKISYTHLLPVASLFGASNVQTMSSSTFIRNQPYQSKTASAIICT